MQRERQKRLLPNAFKYCAPESGGFILKCNSKQERRNVRHLTLRGFPNGGFGDDLSPWRRSRT